MAAKHQNICVAGLLVVDNKALVVRRSSNEKYMPGYYELPGGKVDFGEHPNKGLEREFLEEVNLNIKVLKPYRVFTYITHEGNRHTVEIVLLVELDDKIENLKLSDAHDDHQWITEKDFERFKISDEIKANVVEGFELLK